MPKQGKDLESILIPCRARAEGMAVLSKMKMAAVLGALLAVIGPAPTTAQQTPLVAGRTPFTIGDAIAFRSAVLQEDRRLNIYLPASYADSCSTAYPVIYLLDGSADEDFLHIVGLVQFGSFPWIGMIPETIVVGIANVDRQRDFTAPARNEQDRKDFPTAGGSAAFIAMLAGEIQPLIDRTYRTDGTRTLIGQSLGGLLAAEILFTRPDLFDNYIIISPSLWWDDQALLRDDPGDLETVEAVFVGVGSEGEVMERLANELYAKIARHRPAAVRLFFGHFPQLDHGDTLHLAVYEAFRRIFQQPGE